MASRRVYCRWCGKQTIVPLQAQTLRCSACNGLTPLQINRTLQSNGNINSNHADFCRPSQPTVAGGVYQLQPPVCVRAAQGPKRALLCGITYKGDDRTCPGSINNVMLMKKLLVEQFRFPTSSILVLTEEGDPSRIPTKKNIRAALRWLVQGCQPGDSLVFHYSGRGSQVKDRDGDEIDGYDESLLPVDYQTEGGILDDELNATIVRPLPRGAVLHSIIDSSYSGTLLDLPNVCRIKRQGFFRWEDHRVPSAYRGTSGGLAISISACGDHENPGDAMAFTGDALGALTYSFVQTLEQKPGLTYGHLHLAICEKMHVALGGNAPPLLQVIIEKNPYQRATVIGEQE